MTTVPILEHLGELLDSTQQNLTTIVNRTVARKYQLRLIANPAYRGDGIIRMNRVPQAQNVGMWRLHGDPRSAITILKDNAVNEDTFIRRKFQNKTAHSPPRPRRPFIMLRLISISAETSPCPARTRFPWRIENIAKESS